MPQSNASINMSYLFEPLQCLLRQLVLLAVLFQILDEFGEDRLELFECGRHVGGGAGDLVAGDGNGANGRDSGIVASEWVKPGETSSQKERRNGGKVRVKMGRCGCDCSFPPPQNFGVVSRSCSKGGPSSEP